MKIGQEVFTPFGTGAIIDIEHYSRIDGGTNRYVVEVDSKQAPYNPMAFWPDEIKKSHHINGEKHA